MKMNYFKYILLLFACISFSSCLTSGLDDLPAYEDADIKGFTFEYRWMVKEGTSEKLRVQKMNTQVVIENNTVTCKITVPEANGQFTQQVRDNVALTNLNAYCSISTAATISPVGDAPVLGKIGDFSKKDMKYRVVAADGKTVKEWNLVIGSFQK